MFQLSAHKFWGCLICVVRFNMKYLPKSIYRFLLSLLLLLFFRQWPRFVITSAPSACCWWLSLWRYPVSTNSATSVSCQISQKQISVVPSAAFALALGRERRREWTESLTKKSGRSFRNCFQSKSSVLWRERN